MLYKKLKNLLSPRSSSSKTMRCSKDHVGEYRQLRICLRNRFERKEGVEKARLHDPDVIILDLFLPDMTGIRHVNNSGPKKKRATYR